MAAYVPVAILDLGIVVKMDLEEIREPFIMAALIASGIGFIIIILGAIVFSRISNPILEKLATEEVRLLRALGSSPSPLAIISLSDSRILYANPAVDNIFAMAAGGIVGTDSRDIYVNQDDRIKIEKAIKEGGEIKNYELSLKRFSMTPVTVSMNGRKSEFDGQQVMIVGFFDITERIRIEKALLRGEKQLLRAEKFARMGHWWFSTDDQNLYASDEVYSIYGRDPITEKITLENGINAYHPDDQKVVRGALALAIDQGIGFENELRIVRPDGVVRDVHIKGECEFDENGKVVLLFGIIQDISDQKQIERSLRQSQKMEAVGQLTSGIAHDFNNMLGVIMGNLELLQRRVIGDAKATEYVGAALKGSLGGASITKKLLGFSRGVGGDLQIINLNNFVIGIQSLVAKSLTPKTTVETHLADEIWDTKVDPEELENALLNLALNANDAMPNGGYLTIETSNKVLDEQYVENNPGSEVGEFASISVSDTGVGMTPAVMDSVFQPFYFHQANGAGYRAGTEYGLRFCPALGGSHQNLFGTW